MIADDLAPGIWNAIATEIRRAAATREIIFDIVTKTNASLLHIWTEQFGDLAIPLVALNTQFNYYDTLADGTVSRRDGIKPTPIIPTVGDTVVILDLAGSHTYPICIGVLLSQPGYWEGD